MNCNVQNTRTLGAAPRSDIARPYLLWYVGDLGTLENLVSDNDRELRYRRFSRIVVVGGGKVPVAMMQWSSLSVWRLRCSEDNDMARQQR